jgi:hypothetical protein
MLSFLQLPKADIGPRKEDEQEWDAVEQHVRDSPAICHRIAASGQQHLGLATLFHNVAQPV